ncbi:MAG: hypothetical protein QGD94_09260 [Planctomycetia bacterium]|nr:hypothetical protein [Planctomycetia bacterium]
MIHFTDEELEQIVQGEMLEPAHLAECEMCRGRVADATALRERLRSAFAPVSAGEGLAARVRTELSRKSVVAAKGPRILSRLPVWAWPAAAAAAVILVFSLVFYLAEPSSVLAAQAALVEIHNHNLSPHGEFYSEAEPEKLAEYFKDKLGFVPTLPRLGKGMSLRGCCVVHFREQPVGSYVVSTPKGVISVIVVSDRPDTLGKTRKFTRNGHTFWASSFAKCNMVIARLNDYSYCAVGEVPHDMLTQLLGQLLPGE